jgi:hypothetical protein
VQAGAHADGRDLTRAGRVLRVALALATLVGAAGIPLRLAQLEVVSLTRPDAAAVRRAADLDAYASDLALAELAVLTLGALLFARWTARLCDVARSSGFALSTRARRVAVGSWLVPLVQLVQPPRVLASLVEGVNRARAAVVTPPSTDVGYRETARRGARAPRLVIGVWWALWIASRGAELVATLLGGESLGAFELRLMLDLSADALLVCAGMMAQVVVGEVDDAMRAP